MKEIDLKLRPINDQDLPFLLRVFSSTREDELSRVPWTPEQKAKFLEMQFRAQHTAYQNSYAQARFDLILLDDQPVGRLYVDRRQSEIRIVDIAVLPEFRGRAIGTTLIAELQQEAVENGVAIRIHVEQTNRAKRLYERLGFCKIGEASGGVYELMEWKPVGLG